MHVLIVDDEPLARQRLVRMIEQIEGCTLVGEAQNGVEAIDAIEQQDPDIVLMDVRMPGIDGLEAARTISTMVDPPAVIFCTAYDEYALKAFETLAVGYLLKPVQAAALAAAIEKAQRLTKVQRQARDIVTPEDVRKHIAAKTRHGLELIPLENIYCFLADQKYVTVLHSGGETLIDETLKELEIEFPAAFARVHRNALVSVSKIDGMAKTASGHYEIQLHGTTFRPLVSRRHIARVREMLTHL